MEEQEVIIRIKTDTTEADKGVKQLNDNIKKIDSNSIGSNSIKNLKTQLREANNEATRIGETFGYNSKEFIKAAKDVAEIKDKFEEYKATVEAFNPDNKLQAVVSLGKGITGAMQGAVGGFAALGLEGEKNEEIIKRLQGLMAFSSALNSIDDIKNAYKNFGLVIGLTGNKVKENTAALQANAVASETGAVATEGMAVATKSASVATNTLGTAFKALGIGLLISAIAYLVSNWDDLKDSLTKLFPFLEGIGDKFNKLVDIAKGVGSAIVNFITAPFKSVAKLIQGDFKGALDEAKNGLDVVSSFKKGFNEAETEREKEHQKELLAVKIDADKRKLEALKASGKDTYQLEKQLANEEASLAKSNAEKILKNKKELTAEEIADLSKDNKEKYDKYLDATGKIQTVEAEHQKKLKELREKEKDAIKQQKEKHDALLKQLQDYILATDTITREALERAKNQLKSERDIELNNAKIDAESKVAALKKGFEDEKLTLQKAYEERIKIEGTDKQLSIIRDKEFADAKTKITTSYLAANNALTEEAKAKELEINKKYSDKISDYLKAVNAKQLDTYQQERDAINKTIEDLLKNATEAEKKLLESSRAKQIQEVDKKENLYKNSVSASTNLVVTKTENTFENTDSPEGRKFKIASIAAAEIEAENAAYLEKRNALQGRQLELEQLEAQHQQKLTEIQTKQKDDERQIDLAKIASKQELYNSVSNTVGALGNLFDESTVLAKGAALTQIVIDTAQAISSLTKHSEANPANSVTFGGAGAIQFALGLTRILTNIAKAKSLLTSVKGGSGASVSTPTATLGTAPSITPTALNPLANQVQNVRLQNSTIRAVITNRDLQDNQTRNSFLNDLGSF